MKKYLAIAVLVCVAISSLVWHYYYSSEAYYAAGDKALEEAQLVAKGDARSVAYQKAMEAFRKSAEMGNIDGTYAYAHLLEGGVPGSQHYPEIPPAPEQAYIWYSKSANAGDAQSQLALGNLYGQGLGVGQDWLKAIEWWNAAAKKRNAQAEFNLASAYANGDGVKQDYEVSAEMYLLAAEHDHARAKLMAGQNYLTGRGTKPDIAKGITLVTEAAEAGINDAQLYLAEIYQAGELVPKNDELTQKWARAAAGR